MRKSEQKFQTKFGLWVREKWWGGSAAFELKVAKDDEIALSAFRKHQITALLAAKRAQVHHKLPDTGYAYKPFDSFVLRRSGAFAVILFASGAVMIDIEVLIRQKKWNYKDAVGVGRKLW